MPNHFHGVIIITKNLNDAATTVETPRRGVSTSPQPSRLQPNSLGSIINQFKSVCTKRIRAAGHPQFAWQSRFYDHIIRNEKSLMAIRQYIYNNPAKWEFDRENPESVWY